MGEENDSRCDSAETNLIQTPKYNTNLQGIICGCIRVELLSLLSRSILLAEAGSVEDSQTDCTPVSDWRLVIITIHDKTVLRENKPRQRTQCGYSDHVVPHEKENQAIGTTGPTYFILHEAEKTIIRSSCRTVKMAL